MGTRPPAGLLLGAAFLAPLSPPCVCMPSWGHPLAREQGCMPLSHNTTHWGFAFHAQVAFYRSLLPRPLAALPGGGLVHGSIVEVSDQEQQFKAQLVISHRVRVPGAGRRMLSSLPWHRHAGPNCCLLLVAGATNSFLSTPHTSCVQH